MSGFEQLAIYSVTTNFAGVGLVFQYIFSTIWAPIVYKWAAQGVSVEKFNVVTRLVVAFVLIIFMLTCLCAWLIVRLLPPEYHQVQWLLPVCLLTPLLLTLSEATSIGIGISRKTSFSMLASLIACGLNFLGNIVLVPHFGAAGAAASTSISCWLFFAIKTEFSMYLWQHFPRLSIYCLTALMLVSSGVYAFFEESLSIYIHGFWLLFFTVSGWAYKSEIYKVVDYVSKKFGAKVNVG